VGHFCPPGSGPAIWTRFRIRIQQLKLMRIHADPDTDPDPKPWLIRHGIRFGLTNSGLDFGLLRILNKSFIETCINFQGWPTSRWTGAATQVHIKGFFLRIKDSIKGVNADMFKKCFFFLMNFEGKKTRMPWSIKELQLLFAFLRCCSC
jgi:hypothetical protein